MSQASITSRNPAALLEAALLFTIVCHALAMASMVLLLLPGMTSGPNVDVAARAGYIAEHPWLWRLGWFPWQVTAASDLLLCVAMLRTPWIPRLPAVLAAVATVAAIVPDQSGQFRWTWEGVALAQEGVRSGDFGRYLPFEAAVFHRTAGWGPVGYIAGALGWTWCFAAANVWSRRLTWLSIAAWGIFAAATSVLFLPERLRTRPGMSAAVSIGNAVAFILLMWWLVDVTERVLRRGRPEAAHGSHALWRHPARGLLPRLADAVANSRLARALARGVPGLAMASDISDVIYINYLVESEALEPFVRPPLKLQRLGPDGRYALFTFLTYRHGGFGPVCCGPLRRFWPSPVQSNWRIHVFNPGTGTRGIQFLTTAITSTPHALATRLLAEGVPMHVPAAAHVRRGSDGAFELLLDPGDGTSPDARAALTPSAVPALEPPWSLCFASWREMLAYCVPQNRAMCVSHCGRVTRQEIVLSIPLESCRPVAGTVASKAARAIAGEAMPLCFVVDRVAFRFTREEEDRSG